MEALGSKLTANEFDDMRMPMSLDLVAMFSLMQEDILALVDTAEKEGWDEDRLIKEIGELI